MEIFHISSCLFRLGGPWRATNQGLTDGAQWLAWDSLGPFTAVIHLPVLSSGYDHPCQSHLDNATKGEKLMVRKK